jgi:hypothetical protein
MVVEIDVVDADIGRGAGFRFLIVLHMRRSGRGGAMLFFSDEKKKRRSSVGLIRPPPLFP